MTLNEAVRTNIRRIRKEKDLSLDRLSHLLGYSECSTLARIEKGFIDFDTERLEQFSKILDVSLIELLKGSDTIDPLIFDLYSAFNKATVKIQNIVKELLDL